MDCKYFTTSLYELDKEYTLDLKALDSFLIMICIGGEGTVTDSEGNTETLRKGETILIPASTESVKVVPEGNIQFLTSYVK